MRNSTKTKKWIAEIIEISLLLMAFGIVIEILFGSIVPFESGIMMSLVEFLSALGDKGLVGLAALGIFVYILRRGKVFA